MTRGEKLAAREAWERAYVFYVDVAPSRKEWRAVKREAVARWPLRAGTKTPSLPSKKMAVDRKVDEERGG